MMSEYWNGMADLAEIAVDRRARGRGVAAALLARVEVCADDKGFGLIRLETQSNNPAACRVYARAGYTLGGFDQIGRASCRERGWQYVEVSGVAVSLKKKQSENKNI